MKDEDLGRLVLVTPLGDEMLEHEELVAIKQALESDRRNVAEAIGTMEVGEVGRAELIRQRKILERTREKVSDEIEKLERRLDEFREPRYR